MDPVIKCLIDDDTDALAEEAPDGFFILPPPSTLPKILTNRPSLTAISAFYGARKCFNKLVSENDSEINCDENGRDAIHFACAGNRSELCEYLCDVYNQQHNQDNSLMTALHYAVQYSARECVDVLIKNKVNVNAKDMEGITPLHLVRDVCIAQKLIDNGARVNARSNDGASPLMFAAKRGDFLICSFLIQLGAKATAKSKLGWNVFHYAAQSQNVRTLRVLYNEAPEKISCIDNDGRTCLHYAAENGDPQVVVYILKHGCDPNVADSQGMTALHFAAAEGNIVAGRAIIGCGGDVNACDKVGRTCVHFAAMSGSTTAIEFFSEQVSAESTTVHGSLPIHFAAAYDKDEAVDVLSPNGLNARNMYGKTPLAVAAECGSSNAIKALLKNGASIEMEDKSHMKPIDRAIIRNSEEITEILADAGSTPSPMWSRRSSARSSACSSQQSSPSASPRLFARFSQPLSLFM